MKKKLLFILLLLPLIFSSCDTETAKQLDGYWQCDEDGSQIWSFNRHGELGGVYDDGSVWLVKFGTLYVKKGDAVRELPISLSGNRLTVTIDGNTFHFHKIDEDDLYSQNDNGGSSYNTTTSNVPGDYPEASTRVLTYSDLRGYSKRELKIMRNEIFARHGYIFKTADMKNHFASKSWYTPRYNDVNSMLTNIETQNIKLIQSLE